MMSSSFRVALLVLLFCPSLAGAQSADFLPLNMVKAGMIGEGKTVFQGTQVDTFDVEILGVLENIGPKRSLILARLSGDKLEKTGVFAGMSGSPVYIDNRLIGAVAYAFPFAKEPIAGITPIEEMVDIFKEGTPPSNTRLAKSLNLQQLYQVSSFS
ncbi:MAG TPA: SpoIVB peptidase S55 domain-containing protein, partial [Acidobacteriota bacterium]|nr:SpoIVB peptidase S55 domain-containing protein [Acidobacteriota bacterium]